MVILPPDLDPELVARVGDSGGGERAVKMGIEFIELSASHSVARMPVEGNRQVVGLLHGGAHVVLGESLGSMAATALARFCRSSSARMRGFRVGLSDMG